MVRRKRITEKIVKNEIGEEIHIFNGNKGRMKIKRLDTSAFLKTDEQYCPDCHCLLNHKDEYWECDICKYSITDEEVKYGDGYPTLKSTYENDYEEYYNAFENNIPEGCKACGGPWPNCESSCKIFDE